MSKQPLPLPSGAIQLCVDRFEGEIAVLEQPDGTICDIPRAQLPEGTKAGQWLVRYPDGSYQIDQVLTQQRRAAVEQRLEALLKRKK
ncbi:MAG: DUF3006 domain-containing protein [Faecalibacterium sp.]